MTKRTRYFMAGSAAVLVLGLCTGLVAYYGGGFQALSASTGPDELNYVPADATVVAYADVRAIMDSDLRQRLKQVMPMHDEKGQKEFQEQTGIDIERDIDYVVAAMTPAAGHTGLVIANGRFDVVRLEGLAREHGGTLEEYHGKRLVVGPSSIDVNGEKKPLPHQVSMAFLQPGIVAVGESATVKHAIDTQMSTQTIRTNGEMMDLVSDIGRNNNVWAVGRFDVIANQARLPEQVANQLPAVKWFAAAGHINGGISGTLRAEARDELSAENLRDVVRGFLALGRMQAQADPKVAAMLQSLQLTGTGRTVQLSFAVPSEVLDMISPKSDRH
jgi:hypothetical protein